MKPRDVTSVTILGNFSGRNAGDAAILDGLLRDLTAAFPATSMVFHVPTISPRFVRRTYARFPVRPVSLLPTNLSLKILGLPVVRATLGADLVLVTDAILFDRRLYNPLFNYLHTLSWVLPLAASRSVPVVLYNVSLGPVSTPAGRRCLRRVARAAKKIIVRDHISADLLRDLDPTLPAPIVAADCALSAQPASADEVAGLARRHGVLLGEGPVLGFNVNSYMDTYVRGNSPGIGEAEFGRVVAAVLDQAVEKLGVRVLLIETQPMDLRLARRVLKRMRNRSRVAMVANPPFGHAEIARVLAQVDAFVGMRTHSLILAASMLTALSGIICYPKNRGFLRSIGREDGMLEFSDFSHEALWALVRSTWEKRGVIKEQLLTAIERERAKARASASLLAEWLDPKRRVVG